MSIPRSSRIACTGRDLRSPGPRGFPRRRSRRRGGRARTCLHPVPRRVPRPLGVADAERFDSTRIPGCPASSISPSPCATVVTPISNPTGSTRQGASTWSSAEKVAFSRLSGPATSPVSRSLMAILLVIAGVRSAASRRLRRRAPCSSMQGRPIDLRSVSQGGRPRLRQAMTSDNARRASMSTRPPRDSSSPAHHRPQEQRVRWGSVPTLRSGCFQAKRGLLRHLPPCARAPRAVSALSEREARIRGEDALSSR